MKDITLGSKAVATNLKIEYGLPLWNVGDTAEVIGFILNSGQVDVWLDFGGVHQVEVPVKDFPNLFEPLGKFHSTAVH